LFEWVRRGRRGRGDDTLSSIVTAAAHDIRSPLTAMKGFGYALAKRWDDMDDEQRDLMLRGIVHDADRMDTIVRQLVDAARVQMGGFEAFREPTDLGEIVRHVAEQLARDPDHPAIRWTGDDVSGLLDAVRLKTTVLAFVEALVWWGSEGDLEIHASSDAARLRLVASRAANAIDGDVLEALFEARAPGSGGGSKIGLYVARRVAEAQGGRVWGEHAEGRLSFHVELPLGGSRVSAP
jgi:signal transduction histidine kinase